MNGTDPLYTKNGTISAVLDHQFIQYCDTLFGPILPVYYTLVGAWAVIAIVWVAWTYVIQKHNTLYAQKAMTLIPIAKLFELAITAAYIANCPWPPSMQSLKYLDMARISIVTIASTIYLALFYILCQGWNVISFALTRDQATYLTMIMGATYLSYSAYFLSS